jgi:hypothetical protein
MQISCHGSFDEYLIQSHVDNPLFAAFSNREMGQHPLREMKSTELVAGCRPNTGTPLVLVLAASRTGIGRKH